MISWNWSTLLIASAAWFTTTAHAQDLLQEFDAPPANWSLAGSIYSDPDERQSLVAEPGNGILVNEPTDHANSNLHTAWEHADIELEVEFLMPAGSNSGIYFQGRYEVQLLDSWGKQEPTFSDCGGIYQRWDVAAERGFEGHAPRFNASRAPGLWQSLKVVFEAPRFDRSGRKTRNARFVLVEHNGSIIHQNVEVTGPTRSATFEDEQPSGPLMIQGDHGPIAFRNLRYKRYGLDRVQTQQVSYRLYEGPFEEIPQAAPSDEGAVGSLAHHTVAMADPVLVAYAGTMQIPTSGMYRFSVALDWITGDPHFQDETIGGATVHIGDRLAVRHASNVSEVTGLMHLDAGAHPFSFIYFKKLGWRAPDVELHVEGPDTPRHALTASRPPRTPPSPIQVEPLDRPVILRGFVQHGDERRTRAISVGTPDGVHYSLDTESAALLHLWRGPFVDATPMWHGRGQSQLTVPRGSAVTMSGSPTWALLEHSGAAWPSAVQSEIRFLGYELDPLGRPVFQYSHEALTVEDRFVSHQDGRYLQRMLVFRSDATVDEELWVRIAAGASIHAISTTRYAVNDRAFYIDIQPQDRTFLRKGPGLQELLVRVRLDNGDDNVGYRIIW